MRIVVTGGRRYTAGWHVKTVLSALHAETPITELATGACPYGGADELAETWAKDHEIDYRGYVAKFRRSGGSAGPARNARMLDDFKPDAVVAFPGGNGTNGTVALAAASGIRVIDHRVRRDDPS